MCTSTITVLVDVGVNVDVLVDVDVFSNPTKERSTLPKMPNSYCRPGRAGDPHELGRGEAL